MQELTDVDYAKIGYAAMRECRIILGTGDFPTWGKLPKHIQGIYTRAAKNCRNGKFSDIIRFLEYISKQLRRNKYIYAERYSEKMKRHPFVGEMDRGEVRFDNMTQAASFMIVAMFLAIQGTDAIEKFTKHPG